MNIEVEMDRVVVENQEVKRPARITRSDWMAFWENQSDRNCYRCGKRLCSG